MKKIILTLGAMTLLASPALFAADNSLQEHLAMQEKLEKQEQKKYKNGNGNGNGEKKQHQYKGSNPDRSGGGGKGGGRR